jgi:predicted HD superfamily hydrolase involved in NAD metabolism
MERNALLEAVRGQMPEKRWKHTLGVMETSVILAKRFGADPEKADLAAILHDVAKYWPIDRMAETIRSGGLPAALLAQDKELWHAPVGAYVAAQEYGVKDEDVLNAIRYHTSGREGMSKLEMVVCLADYMEPGRSFPGVDKIRELAEHSLERALVAGFDSTVAHLLDKGKRIEPLTILARNDLIMRMNKEAD